MQPAGVWVRVGLFVEHSQLGAVANGSDMVCMSVLCGVLPRSHAGIALDGRPSTAVLSPRIEPAVWPYVRTQVPAHISGIRCNQREMAAIGIVDSRALRY